MFTGLVQAVEEVVSLQGGRLVVSNPFLDEPVEVGESIAINGVCLTAVAAADGLAFDLSEETLARTNLGDLTGGSLVNLERAMRASDRFGGHIVQGHVDAVGQVVSVRPQDGSTIIRFRIPEGRYVIDKGSITLDGISLTVVSPEGDEFDTWIIPHTLEHTNLSRRRAGDRVNVEYDVLAKYVERLLRKD